MQPNIKQIEMFNKKIDVLKAELEYLKFLEENDMRDHQLQIQSPEALSKEIKMKQEMALLYEKKISELISSVKKDPLEDYLDQVILGDCIEHLERIPDDSVHLFLSDIPYGINLDNWDVLHKNTNSALLGASPAQQGKNGFKRRGKPINGWNKEDRNINKDYQDWVIKWAQLVFPIMKEGAPVFVFGARRTIANAIVAFEKAGFLLKDILAWEKGNAHHRSQDIFKVLVKRGRVYRVTQEALTKLDDFPELIGSKDVLKQLSERNYGSWTEWIDAVRELDPALASKQLYALLEFALMDEKLKNLIGKWKGWKLGNLAPYYEPIAWFMKPYNSVVTLTDNVIMNEVGAMNMNLCKVDDREPKNILKFDLTKDELSSRVHDAQKPIELIKYLIRLTTLEEQIVLDPFAGSGTTAAACKELNRRFISFEINPEYYLYCKNRLKGRL